MVYKLEDLIDINHFQSLQDKLNAIYSFPSAIIDNDGKILTTTAWQNLCTKFHRANIDCEKECKKSNQYILNHFNEADPGVTYNCPFGLVNNSVPIIIDGHHYGNFVTSQFFLEQPDLEFYKAQALKYGFNQEEYLDAVKKIPICSKEQLDSYLIFIKGLIEIISTIGLKNLKEIETRIKLEESEEKFRNLFENSAVGIVLSKIDGSEVLEANKKFHQILGYNIGEIKGKPSIDSWVIKSERDRILQILKQEGKVENFKCDLYKKNGEIVHCLMSIKLYTHSGILEGSILDISQLISAEEKLRESETKFRAMYENSRDAIAISKEGIHIITNPAYLKLFGYLNEQELIGNSILDLIAPSEHYRIKSYVQKRSLGESVPTFYETIGLRKDGTEFPMEVQVSTFQLNDQNHTMMLGRDITERKRAEESLQALLAFNQQIIQNMRDGVVVYDLELRYRLWNPAMEKIGGMRSEDVIGKRAEELFPMLKESGIIDSLNECITKGVTRTLDFQYYLPHLKKSGWASDVSSPLKDASGKIIGVISTVREITDRKQVEEKLLENEGQQKNLLEKLNTSQQIAKIGSWEWDLQTNKIWWSEETYRIFGVNPSEYEPDFEANGKFLHPEDLKEYEKVFLNCLETGQDLNFDVRLITPMGILKYCNSKGKVLYNFQNKPIRFSGVIIDITERKLAEEHLRDNRQRFVDLVNSTDGIVWEADAATFNFTFVSQKAERLLGYSVEDWYRPGFWIEHIHPDDKEFAVNYCVACTGKMQDHDFEYRFITKDGTSVWLRVIVTVYKQDGAPRYLRGIMVDITERKHAEEKLLASEERYRRLVELSPDMIAVHRDGKFIYINPAGLKMFGASTLQEMIGKPIIDFVHTDYRQSVIERVKKSLAQNTTAPPFEEKFLRLDGSSVDVEVSALPIFYEGNPAMQTMARDITERKRAEKAIKESEEKYRSIFEGASIGIFHSTFEGKFIDVNFSLAQMLGYNSPKDVLSSIKNIATDIYATPPIRDTLVEEALQKGKTVRSENLYKRKDGSEWFGLLNLTIIKDENGQPLFFEGFVEDISERKKAEDAIKESEEKFKIISSNTPDHIISMDNDLRYTFVVNPQLGLTEKEMLGKTDYDILSKEDADALTLIKRQVLQSGKITSLEVPLISKIGKLEYFDGSFIPMNDANGNANGLIGYFRNVTERKRTEQALHESEKKFRNLVQNLHAGIVVHAPDTQILFANEQASVLLGLTIDQMMGKTAIDPAWKFVNEDRTTMPIKDYPVNQVIASRESLKNQVCGINRPSKKDLIWVQVNAFPEFASNGNLMQIVVTFVDITEQKLADEELEKHRNHLEELVEFRTKEIDEMNRELKDEIEMKNNAEKLLKKSLEKEKELSQLKSRFISTASHEFRTPLSAILSSLELTKKYGEKWDKIKKEEHYNRIINSIDYLTHLLDEVILVNRAESGKLKLNLVKTDLKNLCELLVTQFETKIDKKHELIFTYKSRKKNFNIDPNQMHSILENLLSNAFKYSPNGGKIELQIESTKESIIISVKDQGIGIPQKDMARLFEPFHRAENVESIKGSGLGLSIVKNAVNLHHGTIKVDSKIGSGTTFWVEIPC